MSGNGHCFVEWKEHFVSQERGSRVVHYFLKDSNGVSILAVVGTERSIRHMFYVVADEFLQAYGPESSVHSGFKWRSRREVVDWLTSMLSKQHLHGEHSELLKYNSNRSVETLLFSKKGVSDSLDNVPDDKICRVRDCDGSDSDIVWSGTAWICGKQLKHYPEFSRNGTSIAIQSFVFIMAKGDNQYLAYLEDMYEDKRGQKKVKVRWFHHSQEVKGAIPLRNSHPKEVFMTPYAQTISAECVDGPAAILTREHYKRCLEAFPHALSCRIHFCYRQFRSNKLKPFNLSKLRGYLNQPILSCLDLSVIQKPDLACDSLTADEDAELTPDVSKKVGAKRRRSSKGYEEFEFENSRIFSKCQKMVTDEQCKSFKFRLSNRRMLSWNHVEINKKIEVLCQDSGIRGCWFRCSILRLSGKLIRVRYDDLVDEDGSGNLEEWIPAFKIALPDKLGMRHSGRPTIRPALQEPTELAIKIGVAVDAWWSDGWWEGVITEINDLDNNLMHIFLPGENLFLDIPKKDLRVSKDWLGDSWTDIEAKPDILLAISSMVSSDTKLAMSSNTVEGVKSVSFDTSNVEFVPTATKNSHDDGSNSHDNSKNDKDDEGEDNNESNIEIDASELPRENCTAGVTELVA